MNYCCLLGVSWCCGNCCWLAIVLWCGRHVGWAGPLRSDNPPPPHHLPARYAKTKRACARKGSRNSRHPTCRDYLQSLRTLRKSIKDRNAAFCCLISKCQHFVREVQAHCELHAIENVKPCNCA